MLTLSKIIFCILLFISFDSCLEVKNTTLKQDKEFYLIGPEDSIRVYGSLPPFETTNMALFFEDVPYGEHELTTYDLLIPHAQKATALCVLIHGGGFVSGDKSNYYTSHKKLINKLLKAKIAVATVNYRLLEDNNTEGLLRCLLDAKLALQTLRYYSSQFNIDKSRVVLLGGSAGAGTSLWLGLNDEMAEPESEDPILRESTRVSGVVAYQPQAHYDIPEWHSSIFSEYEAEGFDYDDIKSIIEIPVLLRLYGVASEDELFTARMQDYRDQINLLELLTSDDPECYIQHVNHQNTLPNNKGHLYHHPLHSKAIMDRINEVGVTGVFHIPSLGYESKENIRKFIIRKLGN